MQLFYSLVCVCSLSAVNNSFRILIGASQPAGMFGLAAVSCLSIDSMENHRRSKNNHLFWIMLPFLDIYCPESYIVWMCPFPPWLTTCTCGVWQIGFLCQEKGPLGMTGGQQSLTPSFSPMQSQDVFPLLNTVGNHMHKVELKDRLCEEGL